MCRLLNDQWIIVISSFISPSEDIRRQVADIIGAERFHHVFMDAGLEYCRQNKPELYNRVDQLLSSNLS